MAKADVSALYNDKLKQNIENLLQYDCHNWLNRRPPELITLLRYICNIKGQHLRSDPNLEFALARTVEQIYGLINKNLVLPLSFKENILTYKLTHSKQLINYNGRMTAAGSYTNLTGWLTSQAASPVEVPRGLIRNLMDNEQVVGKNRLIKADNKVPVSVVTSHAHISIDEESNMQTESEYKLGNWFFQQPTEDQIEAFLHLDEELKSYFRITRNQLIEERLKAVATEHSQNPARDFTDNIVELGEQSQNKKICVACGASNDPAFKVCRVPDCHGSLIRQKIDTSHLHTEKGCVKPAAHFKDVVNQSTNSLSVTYLW